jgi:hypothetical protein
LAGFSKEVCGSTLATPFEHIVKKVNTQGVENINTVYEIVANTKIRSKVYKS